MKLRDYQEKAVSRMVSQKCGGLFFEMGLGKTATIITALRRLDVRRVLVIAPKLVALSTWPAELKEWWPDAECVVAVGTAKKVREALAKRCGGTQFVITNFERLEFLSRNCCFLEFDACVVDESSRIKSMKAQRTKILLKNAGAFQYRFILSGTPAPNARLEELFTQMRFLDFGQRLGKTLTNFRARWCQQVMRYFGATVVREYIIRSDNDAKQIRTLCGQLCVAAKAKDYMALESIYGHSRLPMSASEEKAYKVLKSEAILQLESSENIAFTTGTVINRLAQFTGGRVYYQTDEGRKAKRTNTLKLDALSEMLEGNDEPTIIAYNYQFEKADIMERFPEAMSLADSDEPARAVERWNLGDFPIMLIHPQSAGHGLNLQKGGHHIIWYSLPWSFESYQQTNGRLIRSGQTKTVIVHHLLIQNTVDQIILNRLNHKGEHNDNLLECLKRS